jgi:exosome complex component RRP4
VKKFKIRRKKMSKEDKREIVVPGEVVETGKEFLPGDHVVRQGDNLVAHRYGVVERSGKLVKIIPISGVFIPWRGNVVVGRITEISFNGWLSNIDTAHTSFLPVSDVPKYLDKNNLGEFLEIGDFFNAKIKSVKNKGIDLTLDGRGLGKLEGGMIFSINSNKVPRVIGKEGSMIKIIKDETNCRITVGQNGIVWVKGDDIESELLAKKAVNFITEKTLMSGLTDKVQEFFNKEKGK